MIMRLCPEGKITMSSIHRDRIEQLRAAMRNTDIDAYLVPTSDFHSSEYSADFFKTREYFSGFTGSAGTLLVTESEACLWTDGRYFIQAAKELDGSGISLMRMGEPGVPTITEYVRQNIKEGQVLGFDGRCIPYKEGKAYEKLMKGRKGSLKADRDLAEGIWEGRPALPCHPVEILEEEYTGEDIEERLSRLREAVRAARYQQALHRYHSRKVHARSLEEGDLVLRRAQSARGSNKLTPKWEGPYRVVRVTRPGAVRLETEDGTPVQNSWNIEHLRKFYP